MEDIRPIGGLEELLRWTKPETPFKTEPLGNYKRKNGAEVLLCHDMMGGYLDEEKNDGKVYEADEYPYIFLNWWNIDIFNYFSHNFVTIPPEGYTKIAHQHGVLSLGTFITEWTGGALICHEILNNEEILEKVADALVQIADYYGFDGYLINVENPVSPVGVYNLLYFLQLLTSKIHASNENSRIIWYDSVLTNGKLHWQNALNEHNSEFYNACDGIYLNYNWNYQNLLDSADYGRIEKIFVGIDVFGRGCVGGFNCYKSFAEAKLLRMSIALFAPGWIHEKFPKTNQITMGIGFWQRLYPYISTRKLTNANFKTDFCCGMTIESENTWRFRLQDIAIQPQCLNKFCYYAVGEGLKFTQPGSYDIFNFDDLQLRNLKVICDLEISINRNPAEKCDSNYYFAANLTLQSIQIIIKTPTVLKSFEIISE
ncbi:unnamed protein product [Caenorhabditis bovis]|uniref:Cytosolic endo-beta-N-acetylglucosaminidase TIM barrel domain-containing protein n=1 Tax=Caenorhabditis bovis TaxID=2654633 RepID=A0A8S1ECL8_9PELO|nr:unnamed protein product [Caenorhabditis bovis]